MRTWTDMDAQPRHDFVALTRGPVPDSAGVYALYRGGERQYVGKAANLRDRVWGNHSGRGQSLASSALRRNVAEHLGFGTSADIKACRVTLTSEQVEAVRSWLDACEVAWLECASDADALKLETALKEEDKPPLTKQ